MAEESMMTLDKLAGIVERLASKLNEMDEKFDEKFEHLDERLKTQGSLMEDGFCEMIQRFNGIDKRLHNHDEKFVVIERDLKELKFGQIEIKMGFDNVDKRVVILKTQS